MREFLIKGVLLSTSIPWALSKITDDYVYEDYNNEEVEYINPETNRYKTNYHAKLKSKGEVFEVDAGTTIRLPCAIESLSEELYQFVLWKKMDRRNTLISSGEKILLPAEKKRMKVIFDKSGSSLVVAAAEESDAGKYKCMLSLGEKVQEVEHKVKIRNQPVIHSDKSAKLSLSQGDEMTLTCNTSGPTGTRVQWTKKEGKLPDGTDFVESDLLTVKSVTENHAGTYLCTAMDSSGKSAMKKVEVIVNFPPRVSVSEVVIHAFTGDVAELICKVRGEPSPEVAWSKGGALVKEDKRIGIHDVEMNHYLTIKQVKEKDLGMYTCTATNSMGMGHKDITLTAAMAELSGGAKSLTTFMVYAFVTFCAVFVFMG